MLIPSYQRPARLAACVAALARQAFDGDRYEVLVGLDGPDSMSVAAARRAWVDAGGREGLRVLECPREGYNAVRNRLLKEARGSTLVSMNDDVVAVPEFLGVHHREQRAAIDRGQAAIVTGYSPFRVYEGDTLFDRLVRETSMVFFYDRMVTVSPTHRLTVSHPPDRDWGFRHCWGLNFSCPLGAVREVGGFVAFPMLYGYDDIELAWRLRRRFSSPVGKGETRRATEGHGGMPVLFRPEALAEHDHRYSPRDVLERERKLGVTAWHFAGREDGGAEFCREVFGRDIRAAEEIAYSREFVARERSAAERLEKSFLAMGNLPASAISGPHAAALVNLVYEQHLLLKRWQWRRGLLEAADSV